MQIELRVIEVRVFCPHKSSLMNSVCAPVPSALSLLPEASRDLLPCGTHPVPTRGRDGGSVPESAARCCWRLCCQIQTMRLPQRHFSSSISAFKQIVIFSHCFCFRRNKRRFLEGFAARMCVRAGIGDLFIVLLATNSFMFLNYCSVSFSLVVTLSHTFPGLLLMDLLNDGNEIHQALW